MKIKFKESGTAREVAEGIANQLLYHYAMYKATPSFTPSDPYTDYWNLFKKMRDYYTPFVKDCKTEYFYDETKSPMFTKVIESGLITKVPKEYAVIRADAEHIGLMNMWGQIIGDKGSVREVIKIDVKSRIQTLRKHKIDFEVNGNKISGHLPYGVIHCAEVYGLLEKRVVEPEDKLW